MRNSRQQRASSQAKESAQDRWKRFFFNPWKIPLQTWSLRSLPCWEYCFDLPFLCLNNHVPLLNPAQFSPRKSDLRLFVVANASIFFIWTCTFIWEYFSCDLSDSVCNSFSEAKMKWHPNPQGETKLPILSRVFLAWAVDLEVKNTRICRDLRNNSSLIQAFSKQNGVK